VSISKLIHDRSQLLWCTLTIKNSNIIQLVGVLTLGLIPVRAYLQVPSLGLYFDRVLFLILALVIVLNLKGIVIKGSEKISIILACLLSALVLVSFLANEFGHISTFLAYHFYLAFFIFSILVFCYQRNISSPEFGRKVFYRVMILWAIAAIGFSGWALYNQLVIGNIFYPSFLDVPESSQRRFEGQMSSFRLFLPFFSAPMLGFMCFGIVLVLCIDLNKRKPINRKLAIFLISVLLVLALATQSRSSFYPFVLSAMVLLMGRVIVNRRIKNSRVILILVLAVFSVLGVLSSIYFLDLEMGRLNFDLALIKESRHLSIRLRTLQIIMTSDIRYFFLGHGVGTLADKGIAPYTFTSYLTVLYEIGIFGLILYSSVIFSPILALIHRLRQKHRSYFYSTSDVFSVFLFISVANFLYEFKLSPEAAILLAYVVYMAKIKNDKFND